MAEELRFITAVVKTNNDLERIADLSVNIAERSIALTKVPPLPFPPQFGPMTEATIHMVRQSLNSFVHRDPNLARKVCGQDDEVDDYNRQIIVQIVDSIRDDAALVQPNLQFFSASRYLERIADHATNIAEDVVYMVEGEIIRHGMKSDEGVRLPELDS